MREAAAAAAAPGAATDPERAPAYMAQAVLGFNEQLECIGEVIVVVMVGAMLTPPYLSRDALWFVPLLLLVIRTASALLGLAGAHASPQKRRLIAWFGICGVGSVYYLTYAVNHGLAPETARSLAGLTLTTIAVSVFAHGVSVTPLMGLYESGRARKRALKVGAAGE